MRVGDSLARAESSHARYNSVITHNDLSTVRLPNSHGAQDQGHTRQRQALRGYEHVGAAVSPSLNQHIYITTQTTREGPKPCAQNQHVRSMCSLGLMLWRGFARKCSPPSQGIVNDAITTLKQHVHTNTLPFLCCSTVQRHA